MRRERWVAVAAIGGWYLFVFAAVRPLADAPVIDGWLYRASVRHFLENGHIRFAGDTAAMPIAQVVYGAGWGSIFGISNLSMYLATAVLAALAGIMLYLIALRCGARPRNALLAAALLVMNPCYLLLSFSFMTEVPFIAAMLAAILAFASAEGEHEIGWLWVSAGCIVIAFLERPLAGAAIAGCAGAIVISTIKSHAWPDYDYLRLLKKLAPFALALMACATIWIWLTVLGPKSWGLERRENLLQYIFQVPILAYVGGGGFGPALYLGLVLSPLALLQLDKSTITRWLVLSITIFVTAAILAQNNPAVSILPELTCYGGSWFPLLTRGAGILRIPGEHLKWLFTAIGSLGAASLAITLAKIAKTMNRATIAVVLTAAIYWAGLIPAWLFNDRYYLPMVPAGCVLLALAPVSRAKLARIAQVMLLLGLGFVSVTGLYSYHRGLATMLAARDQLLREGVPRNQIDAGYPMNAEDLYRYPAHGIDTWQTEAGIPMLTSVELAKYTITTVRLRGTRVMRVYTWPGPFGVGRREMYVLEKNE